MKPLRVATLVALIYLVPSLIYIAISTQITANIAADPEQAVAIEILKGMAFVTASGALIFGVCWKTLSVIDRRHRENQVMREALLQAERRAMAGLLAASVAHDAHNELAVLKSNNEFLERRDDLDETTAEVLDDQKIAIEHLIDLTKSLVDVGERQTGTSSSTVDIVEVSTRILDSLRHHSRLEGCELGLKASVDEAKLTAYPALIHQILVNLIFNAADAIDGPGRIEVHVGSDDAGLFLEVHDNGPGIPPSERERIFEAFYTTKDAGTGLGLLSVTTCALAHSGRTEIDDSPLGGACIRVVLEKASSNPYDDIDHPLLSRKQQPDTFRTSAAVD